MESWATYHFLIYGQPQIFNFSPVASIMKKVPGESIYCLKQEWHKFPDHAPKTGSKSNAPFMKSAEHKDERCSQHENVE